MKKGIALGLFAVVALCTAATIQWYSQQTATSSLNDAWGIAVERTSPKAYVYSTIGLLKSHIGTNYILNNNGFGTNTTFYNGLTVEGNGVADGSMKLWNAPGTFGVTFGIDAGLGSDTNLSFPSILHSSVENNIFTNVTIITIISTYSYVTNQYVTTNYTDYSYVTNQYITTNFVHQSYVTNLNVKNLRADIAYISNTFVTNITVTGSQTNAYLDPDMYVMTDANKKLISTRDGQYWTNLPISAQVWTNDGNATWLAGYPGPDYGTEHSLVNGPPFFFTRSGELYIGTNILQDLNFNDPTFLMALAASTCTDSNQPPIVELSFSAVDSFENWTKWAGVTMEANIANGDTTAFSLLHLGGYPTNNIANDLWISSGAYNLTSPEKGNYITAQRNYISLAYLDTNGVWAANAYQVFTNAWPGATNSVNMINQWQKYMAYTPCSITGLVNQSVGGKVVNNVLVTITNAASTNITLYYEGAIRTGDGARSWVITNACEGKLSLEYDPNGSTNGVFRMFY